MNPLPAAMFPIFLPLIVFGAAVPEYCWLSRLVSGMVPNRDPSLFPITLQTVFGDTLSFYVISHNHGAIWCKMRYRTDVPGRN